MKNLAIIVMFVLSSGLFLTSCEKEIDVNPLPVPGNSQQNYHKDGEIITTGSDTGSGTGSGITDGGRDEDYDKTSRAKVKKS